MKYQIAFTQVNHTGVSHTVHSSRSVHGWRAEHAHFRSKLRPADEKLQRNVDENFTNFSFSFRHLVEFSS